MPCLEKEESILDSSSASRSFSFLICSFSFLICSFSFLICSVSFLNLSVSASISSVPLKAEISQESRCAQTEGDEAPRSDGEGDLGDGGGVDVAIKPQ